MDFFFLIWRLFQFFKQSLKGTKANNIKVQSNFFLSYFRHLVQLFLKSMTAFIFFISSDLLFWVLDYDGLNIYIEQKKKESV